MVNSLTSQAAEDDILLAIIFCVVVSVCICKASASMLNELDCPSNSTTRHQIQSLCSLTSCCSAQDALKEALHCRIGLGRALQMDPVPRVQWHSLHVRGPIPEHLLLLGH